MKKIFYILNLLFLTLSVFGGSVFAAAPAEYIGADGMSHNLAGETVNTITTTPVGGNWYYLDSGTLSSSVGITIGTSSSSSPVNIVVNGPVTLSNNWITVPENAAVNFYGATPNSSLSITNGGQYYTIGNGTGGTGNNFGNITFNSGTYTVVQANADTSYPAIGSPNAGGGTITVNAAATVKARNGWKASWNNGTPGVAVGVGDSSQNCTIQVNGGLLQAAYDNGSAMTSRTVSAGKTGTVTISGQGKILSAVNPNDPGDNGAWTINSGIAGYTLGSYPTVQNQWAAVVGGNVTLPEGNLQQNLTPPTNANNPSTQCWNLLTVNPGAVLNLGTTDPGGTATLLVGYSYGTPATPSSIENYGTVNVINLNQGTTYPSAWNNNVGSVLTIVNGAKLNIYQGNFVNSSATSGQSAGEVTIDGILNCVNSGSFTNSGNLTISQTGTINAPVVNGSNAPDSPEASLTLNGDIDGTLTNYSSGSVNVGPIGTVSGGTQPNLINEAGGTVTSQNPCYYGNQVNLPIMNPLSSNPMYCRTYSVCVLIQDSFYYSIQFLCSS